MKILFILPEFEPHTSGGICAYYKNLIGVLQHNSKFKITIIQGSSTDTRGANTIWNGIPIHYLDLAAFESKKNAFEHLSVFPEMQHHVAAAWAMFDLAHDLNIDFDLVVTTDWGLGFLPWIIENKIATNVHLHGSIGQIDFYEPRPGLALWSNLYLQMEADLFSYANCLVTHSNQNIKFWTDRLVEPDKFKLILPAVERPIAANEQNKPETTYNGLVLARIQYWKGPIELCESIKLMPDEAQQKLKIYWAGKDTLYAEKGISMNSYLLKTYPDIWNKIIIPIGTKTKAEIEQLYQKIDFTIVPSNWDMFNMAAVEHLLKCKPLICTKQAGISDFLNNTAAVNLTDGVDGIAEAILNIVNTPKDILQKRGNTGSTFVNQLFNKHTILAAHQVSFKDIRTDPIKNTDLRIKYTWLMPNNQIHHNSREKLLATWPLKNTINLILNSIKIKLFKKVKF